MTCNWHGRDHNEEDRLDYDVEFFIPGTDIEYDVIANDVHIYLGPYASVRQGSHHRDSRRTGYYVHSSIAPTQAMIADLEADSIRWRQEHGTNRVRKYVASKTHRRRLYEGPTRQDFGGASGHQYGLGRPWTGLELLQPMMSPVEQLDEARNRHSSRYEPFESIKLSRDLRIEGDACKGDAYDRGVPEGTADEESAYDTDAFEENAQERDAHNGNASNPQCDGFSCPLTECRPRCRVDSDYDRHGYGIVEDRVRTAASLPHSSFPKQSGMSAESILRVCRGLISNEDDILPSPSVNQLCTDWADVNSRTHQLEMTNPGAQPALSEKISLRSLSDVLSSLTNIIRDFNQEEGGFHEVYAECVHLRSVLQALEISSKDTCYK